MVFIVDDVDDIIEKYLRVTGILKLIDDGNIEKITCIFLYYMHIALKEKKIIKIIG